MEVSPMAKTCLPASFVRGRSFTRQDGMVLRTGSYNELVEAQNSKALRHKRRSNQAHSERCMELTEPVNLSVLNSATYRATSKQTRRQKLLAQSCYWSFNANSICFCDAVFLVTSILETYTIVQNKHMPLTFLRDLATDILESYQPVKYHNWIHAVDVFVRTHAVMSSNSTSSALTDVEKFALAVAALVHDVDHPGHDNLYERRTSSSRSMECNGHSVLERHHLSFGMSILRRHGLAAFFTESEYEVFTDILRHGILCTDMAHHGCVLSAIQLEPSQTCSTKDLVGAILHAADIGAQCLPTEVARVFEQRVLDEFRAQSAKEMMLGLAPSMVYLDDQEKTLKSQLSFINLYVLPIWDALQRLVGGMEQPLENLRANAKLAEQAIMGLDSEGQE